MGHASPGYAGTDEQLVNALQSGEVLPDVVHRTDELDGQLLRGELGGNMTGVAFYIHLRQTGDHRAWLEARNGNRHVVSTLVGELVHARWQDRRNPPDAAARAASSS